MGFLKKYGVSLFCFLVLLGSCEKSRDWELSTLAEPRLVVDAILTNEDTIQEIRLSQSYTELNGVPSPVENAIVSVEANGVVYPFATDLLTPGLYRSQVSFAVVDHLVYNLRVNWEGTSYEASSELASVTPIPPIAFLPFQGTDSLRLADFTPPYTVGQQSMYEITLDWTHLSPVEPNQAKLFFYTFSEVHVSQFVLPSREVIGFPKGSKVSVLKYGLNDEFAVYLRGRAIETDWNSSFFYSTSENPPTNISNGGLGFFSTCSVLRQTVIEE